MLKKLLVFAAVAATLFGFQAGKASADFASGSILNGGFEQGAATGDLTYWTVTGTSFAFAVPGGVTGNGYEAILGTSGSTASISQSFTTTPGQAYTVSFFLANDDSSKTNSFQALWNGTVAFDLTGTTIFTQGAFDYTLFKFTATAGQGNSSTLTFNFQNDNSVYHLSNVSAVPLPPSVLLLGPCLGGLAGLRYRMKKVA